MAFNTFSTTPTKPALPNPVARNTTVGSTSTPFSSAVPGGQPCKCDTIQYGPGTRCYEECGSGLGHDPTGGGTTTTPPVTGTCPPNTPPGRAPCCPDGKVWRDDDKVCEFEDDRQKRGEDTCRGTPVNCPPGQGGWCDFTDAQFKCAPDGSGPGNDKSGARGGGGGGGNMQFLPDLAAGPSGEIWKTILARLNGASRYTPEVMSGLLGGTKLNAENQATSLTAQSNADLAGRNLARSTIGATAQREIRAGVSNTVLQEWGKIQRSKIDADFQDKSEAIKEGLDWINSLRDFIARSNATNAARESSMANINLGYARLQQEMNQLRERYAQQLQLCIISGACAGGV